MPKQQSGQKRAQGGGRTPNSEPKIQVFKEFSGINFELSARGYAGTPVDTPADDKGDQSDLQMNYMYLQNNVRVTSNKTLETRNDIKHVLSAPPGRKFRGLPLLVGSTLYLSLVDEYEYDPIYMFNVATLESGMVTINSLTGKKHVWTSLDIIKGRLVGLTAQGELWDGPITGGDGSTPIIENAAKVQDPSEAPTVTAYGGLVINEDGPYYPPEEEEEEEEEEESEDIPAQTFRISIACSYVNKYGPTELSPTRTFWASKPVTEWNSNQYCTLSGSVLDDTVLAVEFYYATDNAEELIFLGRTERNRGDGNYEYSWHGYSDATNSWHIANLIAPKENYTQGVHAQFVAPIDSRLYFWSHAPGANFRLWIGGNPGNELSVSPGTGGGYVDVEPGTGQALNCVLKYKTQSGNSIVTMLTGADQSRKEQRFNLVENSVSLSNEQSMKSWQVEQVAGAVGCQSVNGAIVCEDGLYTINRYGIALTTMTMEYNSQIRVSYVSDAIKPIFNDIIAEALLAGSIIIELDNILYIALGRNANRGLDNVLLCYDINNKVWWTYTLDVEGEILNMFQFDFVGGREGIGILTEDDVWLLPTTLNDEPGTIPTYNFLIETGKLSTQMPQQGWQYLSQLEFHFDHFIGTMEIKLRATDMFGRDIVITKTITEDTTVYDFKDWMRVDLRLMSYVLTFSGKARFRMTHFLARVYTMSNKMTQVWGFDDSVSHRSAGSVHPTFKCYNDVREAIFT